MCLQVNEPPYVGSCGFSDVLLQIVGKPAFMPRRFAVLMIATIRHPGEPSGQPGGHQRFHRRAGLPCPHLDAVVIQVVERALSNAGGDEHLNAVFAQPAGK